MCELSNVFRSSDFMQSSKDSIFLFTKTGKGKKAEFKFSAVKYDILEKNGSKIFTIPSYKGEAEDYFEFLKVERVLKTMIKGKLYNFNFHRGKKVFENEVAIKKLKDGVKILIEGSRIIEDRKDLKELPQFFVDKVMEKIRNPKEKRKKLNSGNKDRIIMLDFSKAWQSGPGALKVQNFLIKPDPKNPKMVFETEEKITEPKLFHSIFKYTNLTPADKSKRKPFEEK